MGEKVVNEPVDLTKAISRKNIENHSGYWPKQV